MLWDLLTQGGKIDISNGILSSTNTRFVKENRWGVCKSSEKVKVAWGRITSDFALKKEKMSDLKW